VTMGRRQEALEHLTHYEPAQIEIGLQREAANAYDANAVAVVVTVADKGSYVIGYLARALAALIAPLLDAHRAVTAQFLEIRGKYYQWQNYGLALSLSI